MLALFDEPNILARLAETGVVGLCLASILYFIVAPVLRSMFQQQQVSLDLLRRSVEALQEAVRTFQQFQRDEENVHEQIKRTQDEILDRLPRRKSS